jgi:hypothetical protein
VCKKNVKDIVGSFLNCVEKVLYGKKEIKNMVGL